MLKLIITGLLVYFFYRVFFDRPGLGSGRRNPDRNIETPQEEDEGEYIDYEEID